MKTTKPFNLDALYRKLADGEHSIFSPSASSRWLLCPGSLIPNLLAPDNTGIHAAEGTVAHALAEEWLISGVKPKHRLGTIEWIENGSDWFEIPIDRAMFSYVEQYVDWCLMTPGEYFVESRVDFSFLTPVPRQKGTLDYSSVGKSTLYIKDLKYGKGVRVDAEKNTQLMIYALSMLEWLKANFGLEFKKVVLGIGQPRLDHFDEWVTTPAELRGFGEFVRERSKIAWSFDAPRVAGEKQCTFCRVRATCPALAKMAMDVTTLRLPEDGNHKITAKQTDSLLEDIESDLYYLDLKPAQSLQTMHLAKILHYRKPLENWFKSLDSELNRRAFHGESIPGFKMVEGRSNRAFRDQDEAELELFLAGLSDDDMWQHKFTSPAQAEVALRGKGYKPKELPGIIGKLVVSTKGSPTLAPLSDKRPELASEYRGVMIDEDDDDMADFEE